MALSFAIRSQDLPWTEHNWEVVALCGLISSCLSLVGCVFIFVCFFAFFQSRRRKIIHRMVLSLAFCNFVLALCSIVGGSPWDGFSKPELLACHVIAPVRLYFFMCTFFWTSAIATEVLLSWYRLRTNQLGEVVVGNVSSLRQEVAYHLMSWFVPLGIIIWPIIFHSDQMVGLLGCWYPNMWWVIIFLALNVLSCLYCLVIYCMALYQNRSMNRIYRSDTYFTLQQSRQNALRFRVTGYLLAYFVIWIPLAVMEIMELTGASRGDLYILGIVSAILVPITGFLDAVVYGFDRKMWESLSRCCCLIRKRPRALTPQRVGGDNASYRINEGRIESEDTVVFSDSDM